MKRKDSEKVTSALFSDVNRVQKIELPTISRYGLISLLVFLIGGWINALAYQTFEPVLVGCVFLFLTLVPLHLFSLVDKLERQAFLLVFSICWFWAGVAAVYANFLSDHSQNVLDASYFLDIVTQGVASYSSLAEILLTENGGAIVMWRVLYDFFSFLGFDNAPYVGITANTCLVALTTVVGIKMVKIVFGDDRVRIRRFTLFCASCGLFWLFASIHIRDAIILLAVTLLAYYWLAYLAVPSSTKLLKLTAATIVGFFLLGMLRTEFSLVPAAMICAGLASLVLAKRGSSWIVKGIAAFLAGFILIGIYPYFSAQMNLEGILEVGKNTYTELSMSESGNSLGNTLIVNQSLPIRLPVGFVYLFVFPIPFWVGFQLDSVYHLFKSLHVLFMYVITPLFGLSVLGIIRDKNRKTPPVIFLLIIVLGFTFSIAYTSLETRHFGAFFMPLLVLAVCPDLSDVREMRAYKKLLITFCALVGTIHFAWLVLKIS